MPGGFWQRAERDPGHLAVVEPDGAEHLAGDLLARSNQLVHGLRALGLETGDSVATVLPNGIEAVELYLAALQAGWFLTPINFHLAAPEIAYIVDDCEAKALVGHARFSDMLEAAAEESKVPKEARFAVGGDVPGFRSFGELTDAQPTTTPPDRTAGVTMHYTSGTTGRPKGVKRSLSGLDPDTSAELYAMFLGLFGIPEDDGHVHLVAAPNYHTAVTTFGGNSLQAGHTIVQMDKWEPEETLRLIDRYGVTHTHMVPTMFHRMLALPDDVKEQYDISSMRWAIHAAAPCPVDVKRRMLEWWGPVIYEYYAATEGGGTLVTPEEWVTKPGTVGKPWPIAQVKVLDDEGAELPAGEIGTVYMHMDTGDFEYKDDPGKTADSHHGDFFTVGDMGYLDDDGFLFLCDRKSDMIIAGGVNIYPAEIEAELLTHPKVGDAAVFGIPDPDMGEQIKAVIEPAAGIAPDDTLSAELMEYLRPRLGKYKWPRSVDFVDEMPRDPSGKLYKRRLRDPYWEGQERAI